MSAQHRAATARAEPTTAAGRAWVAAVDRLPGAVPWLAAGAAVVVRLPGLDAPTGPDEAGFLQVAAQWTGPGQSLYGDYWVDRPPLLITLFQVAHAGGGPVALRLLGCVAAALTVLLCAQASARVSAGMSAGMSAGTSAGKSGLASAGARGGAGTAAAAWGAIVAAALLCSPRLDAAEVNGELLGAPFVAAGVLALAVATRAAAEQTASRAATGAGAAAVAAVLVKQNLADVVVVAGVALLLLTRGGPRDRRRAGVVARGALVGALAATLAAAVWTQAHGTSLPAVFDAMYPFRVEAAEAVARGGSEFADERASTLFDAWLRSGLALLLVAGLAAARRWTREPLLAGLVAAAAYDAVSVALGAGYWLHYLVQMVVPLAVLVGVLAARGHLLSRVAVALTAAASVFALATVGQPSMATAGGEVGSAIARVAHPGDTLTTLYGQPQINLTAGLPSPYENLWSLPTRTRDPDLRELNAVLTGTHPPTWLVVLGSVSSWGLESERTAELIARDYRAVSEYDGLTVYLRAGLQRATPRPTGAP